MDTESTFRTEVIVVPAWDSGTRERGQHSAELLFLLHGGKGTISFVLYTGWCVNPENNRAPMPLNVFYHAFSPRDPEDTCREDCQWLGGKPCFSGRLGCSTEMFAILTTRGTAGLWEEMERLYHDLFDKEPAWLVEPYEQMAALASQMV